MTDKLVERFREARRSSQLAVIEGFHALKHAIRFEAKIADVVAENREALLQLSAELAPDVSDWLREHVHAVPGGTLAAMTPDSPPPNVMALASRYGPKLPGASREGAPVILLERPTHPGNVGAVIRVAAAAGAAGVTTTGSLDPWHPHVIRGAAGLHFAIDVARGEQMVARLPITALHPEGEPLAPGCLAAGDCLAFGSERRGLSEELLARATRRFAIPMRPGVSSLNLATAVAVTLYVGWNGAGRTI